MYNVHRRCTKSRCGILSHNSEYFPNTSKSECSALLKLLQFRTCGESKWGYDNQPSQHNRAPTISPIVSDDATKGRICVGAVSLFETPKTVCTLKNLDDAFTYGDQLLYDKPTEEEPDKANMETEVEYMVIVPIHQASSIAPPLSTPIIDFTQPKPVYPPIQELIFTATTATTTTTFQPPPPPQ
ncbi:hypothetical protein Tco_0666924 [Tanacetum coccineum]